MIWAIDEDAQNEMDGSTDRACAIIGGSFLENRLTYALGQWLVRDKKDFDWLFDNSGPCSAFDTKIKIAYMTGLISKEFRHDLRLIKDVRNKFAHDLTIKSFDVDPIKGKLADFHLLKVGIQVEELMTKDKCSTRKRYEIAIGEAGGLLNRRMVPTEFRGLA